MNCHRMENTMTNFDIFLSEPKFASFAEVAVSAEKILNIDPAACVLNCRLAMENDSYTAPICKNELRR